MNETKQKLPLGIMLTSRGFKYAGKQANTSKWLGVGRDMVIRRINGRGKPIVIITPDVANRKDGDKQFIYYSDDPNLRIAILSDFTIIPEPTEEVNWNGY